MARRGIKSNAHAAAGARAFAASKGPLAGPRRVAEFREVTVKVVAMLTEKKINVTQRGVEAYVRYNRDGTINVMNLPYVPDDASEELLSAIRGFLDHEVAHVLFTDHTAMEPCLNAIPKEDREKVFNLWNILEDTRIEREMRKRFPGSGANLSFLARFLAERLQKPIVEEAKKTGNTAAIFGAGLVPLLYSWAGDDEAARIVKDMDLETLLEREIAAIDKFKPRVPKLSSTADAGALARDVYDTLKRASAPPPPPPSADKDEDENGDGQPQQGGSPGDSEAPDDADPSQEPDGESDPDQEGEGDGKPQDNDEPVDPNAEPNSSGDTDPQDEGDGEGDDPGESGSDPQDPAEPEGDQDQGDGAGGDEGDQEGDSEPQGGAGSAGDGDEEQQGDGAPEGSDDPQEPGDEPNDEPQEPGDDDQPGAGGEEGEPEEPQESGDEPPAGDGAESEIDAGDTPEPERGKGDIEPEPSNEDLDSDITQDVALELMDGLGRASEQGDLANVISVLAQQGIGGDTYLPYTTEFDRIDTVMPDPAYNAEYDAAIVQVEGELRHMVGTMQGHMRRLFAQQENIAMQGGLRRGRLDPGNLYRMRFNDDRIFAQREETHATDTAVTLLIDCSGSMGGEKIKLAMDAAYALSQTLDRINITHEILGFTTDEPKELYSANGYSVSNDIARQEAKMGRPFSRYSSVQMYEFKRFDERTSVTTKRRLVSAPGRYAERGKYPLSIRMAANADGDSLLMAAARLRKQRHPRKIMMVLSDGQPAANGDAAALRAHLRYAVQECERMKIETVGIGIMDATVKAYYPKNVVINDVNQLPAAVVGELRRFLVEKRAA